MCKTVYIGSERYISRNGRFFKLTEESADAATQAEWADSALARENVQFDNGKFLHEAANEVLEKAEDVLVSYVVLVM